MFCKIQRAVHPCPVHFLRLRVRLSLFTWQYTILPFPSWRTLWTALPLIRQHLEGKKATLWHRLLLGNIMTNSRLHHINPALTVNNLCRLCGNAPETIPHLFQNCNTVLQASTIFLQPLKDTLPPSLLSPLEILFPFTIFPRNITPVFTVYIGTFLWAIWRTLWSTKEPPPRQLAKIICFSKADWNITAPPAIKKLDSTSHQYWSRIHIPDP